MYDKSKYSHMYHTLPHGETHSYNWHCQHEHMKFQTSFFSNNHNRMKNQSTTLKRPSKHSYNGT